MSINIVKIRCVEVGECWEWASDLANHARRRNPELRVDGKQIGARRYAYLQAKGPIQKGRVITPNCGNPYCVNPEHQVQVSHQQRCALSGKAGVLSGPRPKRTAATRNRSKLSLEIARQIRERQETCDELAAEYRVNRSTIVKIRSGILWNDVSPFAGLGAR